MVHKPKIKDEETNNGFFVSSSLIFGLWTIVCLVVFNLWFVDHSMRDKLWSTNQRLTTTRQTMVHKPKIKDEDKNNVCGPLFVSSSLIVDLWTIVFLFVFNRWFVDHCLSLRL
jgi:hypothetical protein